MGVATSKRPGVCGAERCFFPAGGGLSFKTGLGDVSGGGVHWGGTSWGLTRELMRETLMIGGALFGGLVSEADDMLSGTRVSWLLVRDSGGRGLRLEVLP